MVYKYNGSIILANKKTNKLGVVDDITSSILVGPILTFSHCSKSITLDRVYIRGGSFTSKSLEYLQDKFKDLSKRELLLVSKAISLIRETKYKRNKEYKCSNLPRIFTKKKLDRFFSFIYNPDHLFAFNLQYYLALRVGEIPLIKKEHCLFEQNRIKIISEKTKRHDYLPLVEPCKSLISHRIASKGLKNEDLLLSRSKDYLRNKFRKYANKSGLNEIYGYDKNGKKLHMYTSHVIRATAITNFYKKTKDPVKTMRFARHKDMKSTMVYIRLVEDELAQSMRKAFS